jgi:phosphopantetheinyl transferase
LLIMSSHKRVENHRRGPSTIFRIYGTGAERICFSFSAVQKKKKAQRFSRLRGERFICAEPWSAPITRMPGSLRLQCCRAFDIGNGRSLQNLANVILSSREMRTWSQLRVPERRCREWLLGRLCAKDAVRVLVNEKKGWGLVPSEIEIVANDYGRPLVGAKIASELDYPLSISIAHSEGVAVAIAGECRDFREVGIDIEPANRDCRGLEKIILSTSERSLLSTMSRFRRHEWLLRFWCAKEAVAKALGQGMVGGPWGFLVEGVELKTGRIVLRLAGKALQQLPRYRNRVFTIYSGCETDFVYATSVAD